MTQREILRTFRNISRRRATDESNALSKKRMNEKNAKELSKRNKINALEIFKKNEKDTIELFDTITNNLDTRKQDCEKKTNELSLINKANNLLVLAILIYLLIIIPWDYALLVSQIISSFALSRAVSIWNMEERKPGEEQKWGHLWWILLPFVPLLISIYYHLLYYRKGKNAITFRYPNSLQPDKVTNQLNDARRNKAKKLRDSQTTYNNALSAIQTNYNSTLHNAQITYSKTLHNAQTTYNNSLPGLKRGIDEIKNHSGYAGASWNDGRWNNWARWNSEFLKPDSRVAPLIRIGNLNEQGQWDKLEMPAFIPSIGGSNLIIETSDGGKDLGIQGIKSLMLRMLALIPPGKLRFVQIDPVGGGGNLVDFMKLKEFNETLVGSKVWTGQRDIENQLEQLKDHMEFIIQRLFPDDSTTIEEYNSRAGQMGQPYVMLVVINYPANFTDTSVRHLKSIAINGPRCGIYTLMTVDEDELQKERWGDFNLDDIKGKANVIFWDRNKRHFVWNDNDFKESALSLDIAPREKFDLILKQVGAQAKEASKVELSFDKIVPQNENFWENNNIIDGFKVPIGIKLEGNDQYLELGTEKGMEHHCLLVGMTGSGKSNLLHVIINSLGMKYSPEEVELYLIDFKQVEFNTYGIHKMPHARVVATKIEREFGLSVIKKLETKMEERAKIFSENYVDNIAQYRRKSKNNKMTRILLLVDEFQVFFEEDDTISGEAQDILDKIVRLGRGFGIHVLLSSQTLAGTSLKRTTIRNMAVRIALKCIEDDSTLILGDNNPAASKLSGSGAAIYNKNIGTIVDNSFFQVVLLPKDKRDIYLKRIENMAQKQKYVPPEPQNFFNGYGLSDQMKNSALISQLEAFPPNSILRKVSIWLGEPTDIKESTRISFNSIRGNNLIIMGKDDKMAAGMLLTSLIALASQYMQKQVRFYIVDLYSKDKEYSNMFTILRDFIPHPFQIVDARNIKSFLDEISNKINERIKSENDPDYSENQSSIYIVFFGLQRARDLSDEYDSGFSSSEEQRINPTQQFTNIIKEGSAVGVHTLVWCDSYRNFNNRVGQNLLREFDMRVAMRMGEDDSDDFIKSRAANKLGEYRAIYYSEDEGLEKFQPYRLPSEEWLELVRKQFNTIDIKMWKEESDETVERNAGSRTVEPISKIGMTKAIYDNATSTSNSKDILEPLMVCPDHGKITVGYIGITNSIPHLSCNSCGGTFKIKSEKFVFDSNILVNRLFSELYRTGFFDNKSILIPQTVNDEINHWKNGPKNELFDIAKDEIRQIHNACDQGKLTYRIIGAKVPHSKLIKKDMRDEIIVNDSEKENAILITSDNDFPDKNPDVSIIIYRYQIPMVWEKINISIVEHENGDGVGHYKKYKIFVDNAGNMIGDNVNAEIIVVRDYNNTATAILI